MSCISQEQWTPLRCRYSPVQSPSSMPGADHQLERPASFVSRRPAGKLNFSPSALLVPMESPSAPRLESEPASASGLTTAEAAPGSLMCHRSGQSAAQNSGGGPAVLERADSAQLPAKQLRDGELPGGTPSHSPKLQPAGMRETCWKAAAVVGGEFTRGLEHLIPNMVPPTYEERCAAAAELA